MVSQVNCATISGIEVKPVVVETDVGTGLPVFDMVGLLSSDTKEARQRVRTAIKNSGFIVPPRRITINLSPGNIRKTGTYFDLPIAVSILISTGIIQCNIEKSIFVGELSLNGDVVKVNGVLPIVLNAESMGITKCYVPYSNVGECNFLEKLTVIGVKNLNQLVMILSKESNNGMKETNKNPIEDMSSFNNIIEEEYTYDFRDIRGQIRARRSVEIAAAGFHNLLMIGPPGSGKSQIAKTISSILPKISPEEVIQISKIQSIAGMLNGSLVRTRPFRSPHHTVTISAMTGGGINPTPGEVTLAHGGVLFMDEFPEFSRKVIETLRQPLEDKNITISRTGGTFLFPADFILLAAMNPCKCGFYPDRNRCNCTLHDVEKYTEKISGPILDRIDLKVRVNPVEFSELKMKTSIESSSEIRERVNMAVEIQQERYKHLDINFNSQIKGKEIGDFCKLNKKEKVLMEQIFTRFNLSIRSYEKILKVSRTIADLKTRKNITVEDISEAITFRSEGGN